MKKLNWLIAFVVVVCALIFVHAAQSAEVTNVLVRVYLKMDDGTQKVGGWDITDPAQVASFTNYVSSVTEPAPPAARTLEVFKRSIREQYRNWKIEEIRKARREQEQQEVENLSDLE